MVIGDTRDTPRIGRRGSPVCGCRLAPTEDEPRSPESPVPANGAPVRPDFRRRTQVDGLAARCPRQRPGRPPTTGAHKWIVRTKVSALSSCVLVVAGGACTCAKHVTCPALREAALVEVRCTAGAWLWGDFTHGVRHFRRMEPTSVRCCRYVRDYRELSHSDNCNSCASCSPFIRNGALVRENPVTTPRLSPVCEEANLPTGERHLGRDPLTRPRSGW